MLNLSIFIRVKQKLTSVAITTSTTVVRALTSKVIGLSASIARRHLSFIRTNDPNKPTHKVMKQRRVNSTEINKIKARGIQRCLSFIPISDNDDNNNEEMSSQQLLPSKSIYSFITHPSIHRRFGQSRDMWPASPQL